MKEKINDIAEALTLAVSLKTGTVSELKELVCQDVLDKLVEWKWIRLGKDDWRLTSTGLRQSAFYRKPTEKEKELGKLFRELEDEKMPCRMFRQGVFFVMKLCKLPIN